MSQLYRIRLKDSVSRSINTSDSISYPIELTEIIPAEEMKDILKGVLREKGFEETEENIFVKEGPAGEKITVDLAEMEVTASIDEDREIRKEVEFDERIDAWNKKDASQYGRELFEKELKKAEQSLEGAEKQAQKEVTQRLIDSEEERMQQLNEVMQEVYAESLKRKAGSMGEVTSMHETIEDGEYRLDITVEL